MFTFTTKTTPLFKTLLDDSSLWDELTSKTSIIGGYHSEKTDDGYKLEMAVPGLTKEDLKIKIIKGRLNVKSEKENHWISSFDKTFTLPEDSDLKLIKASVENGILLVTIPLNKESENIIEII